MIIYMFSINNFFIIVNLMSKEKIVCCIDVGLRHLAFCIMNNNYEILLWDVVNVLDSDEYKCQGKFKNGKICNIKCNMKYE